MLHHFLDKGAWFRAKRIGYGAGLPFKWQGWVLLLADMSAIIGIALMLTGNSLLMVVLILIVAFAPMPIYAARTEGGWKWRNGEK